ncbi:hypothetical protein C8N24_0723 [Solirubrobacter pauli]|uniref:Uncharacterized protein n=1 Tax=Solirubrobacter pauli TaxID=166793 RepID=A0A660L776_9ACTN|nr:hypothetical protein [Solirubrobacter pauli]RKQ90908.1 hypothetical protein C8N24_0723 [Solirubrobacter pauli]
MIEVGAFSITPLQRLVDIDGETPDGQASSGRGRLYDVSDGGESRLTVRDTSWANGERDVVATERHDSPQRFDTLVARLRLAVLPHGSAFYLELRQARLKANGRANLFVPDEQALDAGAGIAVLRELEQHGATRVGTRETLLDDTDRTRTRLGAVFPREAELVPLVAYVCTRVAPVAQSLQA